VRFVAGGTTLLDLMKLNVRNALARIPRRQTGCRWTRSKQLPTGGLKIGATVRNSDLAKPSDGAARLCRAVARPCSPGHRHSFANMATTGRQSAPAGRGASTSATPPCPANKARAPVLAVRPSPAATARSPSSATSETLHRDQIRRTCGVAMAALEATISRAGAEGFPARSPIGDFHLLTRQHAQPAKTVLEPGRPHHARHACPRPSREASRCI